MEKTNNLLFLLKLMSKEKEIIQNKLKEFKNKYDLRMSINDFCEIIGITRQSLYYERKSDRLLKKINDVQLDKMKKWFLENINKKLKW